MDAIRLDGHIDDEHRLLAQAPGSIPPGPVTIWIVPASEEDDAGRGIEHIRRGQSKVDPLASVSNGFGQQVDESSNIVVCGLLPGLPLGDINLRS